MQQATASLQFYSKNEIHVCLFLFQAKEKVAEKKKLKELKEKAKEVKS